MTRLSLSLSALTLLAAAGCTGSTDPSTATVFDNIRNINSGEYDRQIASREAEAAALLRGNNQRRTNIAALERQRAGNASTIASLRGEVASVRSRISSARASAAGDAGRTAQLNALDAQARAVDSDVAAGGDASVARSELARIRSAVQALSS